MKKYLDWYIEIEPHAPNSIKKNIKDIEKITKYIMQIFSDKMMKMEEFNLNKANEILSDIVDEFPVMRPEKDWNTGEFYIRYSKYVSIKLKNPLKLIYRELKLQKLLDE
jgi:hypothetical protein